MKTALVNRDLHTNAASFGNAAANAANRKFYADVDGYIAANRPEYDRIKNLPMSDQRGAGVPSWTGLRFTVVDFPFPLSTGTPIPTVSWQQFVLPGRSADPLPAPEPVIFVQAPPFPTVLPGRPADPLPAPEPFITPIPAYSGPIIYDRGPIGSNLSSVESPSLVPYVPESAMSPLGDVYWGDTLGGTSGNLTFGQVATAGAILASAGTLVGLWPVIPSALGLTGGSLSWQGAGWGSAALVTSPVWAAASPSSNEYSNDSFPVDYYPDDYFNPIVLDLTGSGIAITELSSSNQYMDTAGTGLKHRTAWAAAGNGVLVITKDGATTADQLTARDFEFTLWDPTAKTDIEAHSAWSPAAAARAAGSRAPSDVFDTSHDRVLSAADADWQYFKVLVTVHAKRGSATTADGTMTLRTLAELGIASINLATNKTTTTFADGSQIQGTTTFTRTHGQPTTARNPDGSTNLNSARPMAGV